MDNDRYEFFKNLLIFFKVLFDNANSKHNALFFQVILVRTPQNGIRKKTCVTEVGDWSWVSDIVVVWRYKIQSHVTCMNYQFLVFIFNAETLVAWTFIKPILLIFKQNTRKQLFKILYLELEADGIGISVISSLDIRPNEKYFKIIGLLTVSFYTRTVRVSNVERRR